MLVLLFEFTEPGSDAESSALSENIPFPLISFILYPEHGLLKAPNGNKDKFNKKIEHLKINHFLLA